jgi:phage terminase large subunit-like protein
MPERLWLPNPPAGTACCGGFDGSENDDHTALRLETFAGRLFTPTYGPDSRPTIWDPSEWNGQIPWHEVLVAFAEVMSRYRVHRMYCDPDPYWRSQIGTWSIEHGEKVVTEWPTNQHVRMHEALKRFRADLKNRSLTDDGCPLTTQHMENARKKAMNGDRYVLMKPVGANHQKIDAAMASVLAHEAACDARAAGWTDRPQVSYGVAFG